MLTAPARVEKYSSPDDIPPECELVYQPADAEDDRVLAAAGDAEAIFADAMRPVSGNLIRSMPNLKLIHSEGVGYNLIDIDAARERGVHVCNCPGVNADSVAEQAVLLMLGVLRKVHAGHQAVMDGHQIDFKHGFSEAGIPELGEKTVGFLGFGAIGRQTALRLKAFGCRMYYYDKFPLAPDQAAEYAVTYAGQDELLGLSDILSIHVPSGPDTRGMVNRAFIGKMRPGAILINTARGDILCQEDVADALIRGRLGGAGLDVLDPEPVEKDNLMVNLPGSCMHRVLFSPHIGGLSTRGFFRAHAMVWQNIRSLLDGSPLTHTVV